MAPQGAAGNLDVSAVLQQRGGGPTAHQASPSAPASPLMAVLCCAVLCCAVLCCAAGMNGVRLVGGTKRSEGRLQVADSGWKQVCASGFGEKEARAACRSMGYYYGGFLRNAADFGLYPPGPSGSLDSVAMQNGTANCTLTGTWTDCAIMADATTPVCPFTNGVAIECYDGKLRHAWVGSVGCSSKAAGRAKTGGRQGAGRMQCGSAECLPSAFTGLRAGYVTRHSLGTARHASLRMPAGGRHTFPPLLLPPACAAGVNGQRLAGDYWEGSDAIPTSGRLEVKVGIVWGAVCSSPSSFGSLEVGARLGAGLGAGLGLFAEVPLIAT